MAVQMRKNFGDAGKCADESHYVQQWLFTVVGGVDCHSPVDGCEMRAVGAVCPPRRPSLAYRVSAATQSLSLATATSITFLQKGRQLLSKPPSSLTTTYRGVISPWAQYIACGCARIQA